MEVSDCPGARIPAGVISSLGSAASTFEPNALAVVLAAFAVLFDLGGKHHIRSPCEAQILLSILLQIGWGFVLDWGVALCAEAEAPTKLTERAKAIKRDRMP
jgi:hypothetical protein